MDYSKALAHLCPGASWSLAGNTYDGIIWHDAVQQKPSREELEEAWQLIQQARGWTNVQQFMQAFTMQEMAQISLSIDPNMAALRTTLFTWLGRVEVNDERVQMGLNRMVELSMISAARKAEIEAQAS